MSILELKNVSFSYPDGFEAIKNLNLTIDQGERVAIIGENGAGKTTVSKLINGLLRPKSGEVRINGKPTKDKTVATIAREVGYVFQNPDDQICSRDIFSEITYSLRYNKLFPPEEIEKRANMVLKLVGMEGKGEENPYEQSYSHRKFITIGSVILQDTELVILDEPTAGQDLECMNRIADIVDYLHKKDKAILVISHDMEFVVNNFDRIIVMACGRIIADGMPREIFWNFDVLKEAALHQPYVSMLAHELGFSGDVMTISEFVEVFNELKASY